MPTLFITGASRGIGLEFVRQYAAEGWSIIACCRNPDKAAQLQALAKGNTKIRLEAMDVLDFTAPAKLAARLKGTSIDVLINNAGIFAGVPANAGATNKDYTSQAFGTLDAEAWDKVLRTNSIAPIMVTQALAPLMTPGGKIIMISSGMGSIESAGEGAIAYRTSKAALNAAMRNVSLSLRARDIAIISFHPGWVQTDMGGSGAEITPQDSVAAMRKTIAGLTMKQSGGFYRYSGESIPW